MHFTELYNESLCLWPNEIDISDGEASGKGILFFKLSTFWDNAENKAKPMGEWFDLMTWIIFTVIHTTAEKEFKEGRECIYINQLDKQQIKERLMNNLQVVGYEDMLNEYILNNPN